MKDENLPPYEIPSTTLVNYIKNNTKHKDDNFIAASIVAWRHDDTSVPRDISDILKGNTS